MTPIRVKVDPAHDASKVKAEGPGLSRSGKIHPRLVFEMLLNWYEHVVISLPCPRQVLNYTSPLISP